MDLKKHLPFIAIAFILGMLLFKPGACNPSGRGAGRPPDARVVELALETDRPAGLAGDSFLIRAELADTAQKRSKGLTGRRGIEQGYGMLYVYPEPTAPEFSSAGNTFPTSLAFLRHDGTIAMIRRLSPGDVTVVTPSEPVSYVLEAREGWFADRGVTADDKLVLPPSLTQHAVRPAAEPPMAPPTESAETAG